MHGPNWGEKEREKKLEDCFTTISDAKSMVERGGSRLY
jgi:hypothetical protein